MKFELSYIDKLAKLLNENNLSELVLKDGEQVVELKKSCCSSTNSVVEQVVAPQSSVVPAPIEVEKEQVQVKSERKAIKSPMVGTFYQAATPEAEPLVSVGDVIGSGQVVCIIEAMKLMNEIESDVAGKIVEICVKDGEPVGFGQVIMYVE